MLSNWRLDRFWSKVDRGEDNECWEWQAAQTSNGYGHIGFTRDPLDGHRMSKRTDRYAHQVAWAAANGRWPREGMYVCHECDNTLCCNPNHLREDTSKSNSADRSARSDWTNQPKLTDHEVQAIRASDLTQIELARKYGVSQTTINNVRNGRRYADV